MIRPSVEFEQLRTEFGATVYGQYASFYMADHWQLMGLSQRPPGMPETEHASPKMEAARRCEQLLEAAPDFPLEDEVMARLIDLYRATGRKEMARETFDRLRRSKPESPVLNRAEALLNYQPTSARPKSKGAGDEAAPTP